MQIRAIGDTIARWTLVALVALMPIFILPVPWVTVMQSKLLLAAALVAVVIISYIVARIAQGMYLIPRDTMVYAAALLPIAYVVSAYASGATAESYASGLGMQDTVASMTMLFSVLALSAVLFAGGARNTLIVLLAFIGGGAIVIFFQIARLFASSWLSLGGALAGSTSSIFGSWHDLGILAALLAFFAVTLFDSSILDRRISRWAFPFLALASLALIVVIGMPDVWYGLAAALILFALYTALCARSAEVPLRAHSMRRAAITGVIGVVAAVAGFMGPALYSHLPTPLQIAQTEVRPSWSGTLAVGEKVFSGTGYLFGTGPNAFQNAWGKYKPSGINETDFWSTDFNQGVGLVPTSFVTAGVLGILAWIALFAAVVFHTVRFVRNREMRHHALHATLLGGIYLLLGFHIIYTPTLAVSLILFLLLGLAVASTTSDHRRVFAVPLSVRSPRGVAALLFLLAFGAATVVASLATARAATSDLLIQKAAADFNKSGDIAPALSLVQSAVAIHPASDRAHRAAVEVGLLQLQKLIAEGNKADANALKTALSNTIESGLQAVSINSGDYQNWLSLAGAYQNLATVGVEGAYENAIAAYEKAALANPTNPLPLIGAGQVALAQGDANASRKYLSAAILLKNNLAVAYFLRSQAEGKLGDFAPAIEDAKAAAFLAQQDPLAWYNLGSVLYASGDYITAAQVLSQAISLSNDYSNAIFVLALSYEKMRDYDSAIRAMQRVVELNPTNETALSTLADLVAASSTPTTSNATGKAGTQ